MSLFKHLGVPQEVLKAIEDLGFTEPSEIQKKAIPTLIKGDEDFIGLAQTGTGKTAAFSLPLLELIDADQPEIEALILAPTRELGQQIAEQIRLFTKYKQGISSLAVYGGTSIQNQIDALRKGKKIIIATPGRLIDLIERRALKLDKIKYLILDEADEMLNMGFKEDLDHILTFTPKTKKTWLFSATMSKEIYRIVNTYMDKPSEVRIDSKDKVNVNIDHRFALVKRDDKVEGLARFLDIYQNMRGLVFCRTKRETQEISDDLLKRGYQVDALHGDLSQAQRDRVMKRFKKHDLQCLIATDVAARGIDVNDLTHVFHFNIPDDFAYYTHRSGRTARAGKKGMSLLFINGREPGKLDRLAKSLSIEFTPIEIPKPETVYKARVEEWCQKIIDTKAPTDLDPEIIGVVSSMLKSLTRDEILARLLKLELDSLSTDTSRDLNQKSGGSKSGGEGRNRSGKSKGYRGKGGGHRGQGGGHRGQGGGQKRRSFKSKSGRTERPGSDSDNKRNSKKRGRF